MSEPLAPLPAEFGATVAALHCVAEALVAPARKPDNEISLRASAGGFGTPEFDYDGARQRVRVEADALVREVGGEDRRAPLRSLAAAAEALADLLPAGPPPDEPLAVDRGAALALAAWYAFGDALLTRLRDEASVAEAATSPLLWPEHFDIAIDLGDEAAGRRATYGFSPGDENHAEPYVYVAPWAPQPPGELWNAHGFGGAELGYAELLAGGDPEFQALRFLRDHRDALAAVQPNQEER